MDPTHPRLKPAYYCTKKKKREIQTRSIIHFLSIHLNQVKIFVQIKRK